jgi:cysteine dioxygenase
MSNSYLPPLLAEFIAAARLELTASAPAGIEALLRAAQFDDASLAPFVSFMADRYTRNCVYRDERFELLLLCWARGARSPIHDHGDSRCFVTVLRGALTIENFTILEHGRAPGPAVLSRTGTQNLGLGGIDTRSPQTDVHRVSALGGPAISLHLYAAPLDRCLVFDVAQKTCRSALNHYDRSPSAHRPATTPAVAR